MSPMEYSIVWFLFMGVDSLKGEEHVYFKSEFSIIFLNVVEQTEYSLCKEYYLMCKKNENEKIKKQDFCLNMIGWLKSSQLHHKWMFCLQTDSLLNSVKEVKLRWLQLFNHVQEKSLCFFFAHDCIFFANVFFFTLVNLNIIH